MSSNQMDRTPGPRGSRGSTLGALADLVGGEVVGDPGTPVQGIGPVFQAGPQEMGLLADRKYLRYLEETRAGSLLVSRELRQDVDATRFGGLLVVETAHAVLPVVLPVLYPDALPPARIHPSAVLGRGVTLGENVDIGPYSVLEEGASVGSGTRIGAHAWIGRDTAIGEDCLLHPHVSLYPRTVLGDRVILHSGVRLGVDGFGYVPGDEGLQKVPQVGACVVEDDVEIGANCCIDRGSIGRTVIGRGTKIDNLVHLAHNVTVGPNSILVAQVGVAGSTRLGSGVVLGGQVGIAGHVEIGDGARLGAQAGVISDVPAGETWFGYPARRHADYMRSMAQFFRLPDMARRLKRLEARGETGSSSGDDE
jgi:UDP-3-O-[3-hydroxymyristoyl] glucosamine N-acyltransferase